MSEDNKFKKAWNGLNKAADKINPVIKSGADLSNKLIDGSSKMLNKGTKKANESLNDVSARATGQKKIKCPRCKSLDIQFLENDRKKFSIGKAVGGAVLTGGIGTLAGFAGKKGKKSNWRCNDCGNTFTK